MHVPDPCCFPVSENAFDLIPAERFYLKNRIVTIYGGLMVGTIPYRVDKTSPVMYDGSILLIRF